MIPTRKVYFCEVPSFMFYSFTDFSSSKGKKRQLLKVILHQFLVQAKEQKDI